MKTGLIAIFLLLGATCVGLARADQIFTTPAGSTAGSPSESVSASADFSLTGTALTIKLSNTLAGISDAGQLLTDLFFTTGTGGLTLTSQTGDLVMVDEDKTTKVQTVTDLGMSSPGWSFAPAVIGGVSGFELCVVCQGGPSHSTAQGGILGPASGDGLYDNANGSIEGNPGHNPFVNGTATFLIGGVAPGSTVGNVIFSFSTTAGANVDGVPSTAVVPEPSSVLLLGVGLLALVGLGNRLRVR